MKKEIKYYGVGSNYYGELGLGDTIALHEFTLLDHLPKNIKKIVVHDSLTVILTTDGDIYITGQNYKHKYIQGEPEFIKTFTKIPSTPDGVIDVWASLSCIFVKTENNDFYCIGNNFHGELGIGDWEPHRTFTLNPNVPKNIIDIQSDGVITFLRTADNKIYGAGRGTWGALGLGDDYSKCIFTEMPGVPKNIKFFYANGEDVFIYTTDDRLFVTGGNSFGILGLGDMETCFKLTEVKTPPKGVIAFEGASGILALTEKGEIWVSGFDLACNFGQGEYRRDSRFYNFTKLEHHIPLKVERLYNKANGTMLINKKGLLYVAGLNNYDQLGLNTRGKDVKKFTLLRNAPKNIVNIHQGAHYTIIEALD